MFRYRRLQIFAAAALAFVFVIGMAGEIPPRHENFPFASWSLFSLVPGRQTEFDLIVHTAAASQPFNRADRLVYHPHSIVIHEVVQQLGDAVRVGNAAAVRALRRQIEQEFIPLVTGYDLVRVTYTPVDRWRTGRVLSTDPVRSFIPGAL